LTLLRHRKCMQVAFLQSSTKSTHVEPLL